MESLCIPTVSFSFHPDLPKKKRKSLVNNDDCRCTFRRNLIIYASHPFLVKHSWMLFFFFFSASPRLLHTLSRYLTSQTEKHIFFLSFFFYNTADYHRPPRGCSHGFPQVYVLSPEAATLSELARGRVCIRVTIHHLSGRGKCTSERLSARWPGVQGGHLEQGVN